MVGERKKAGPNETFKSRLPGATITGIERKRVGAKKKSGVREFARRKGDPEGGAEIADKADHSIELAIAYEFPDARIEQAEKAQPSITSIGNLRPGKALQELNVPLQRSVEFWVVNRRGAGKRAIDDMEVYSRMLG